MRNPGNALRAQIMSDAASWNEHGAPVTRIAHGQRHDERLGPIRTARSLGAQRLRQLLSADDLLERATAAMERDTERCSPASATVSPCARMWTWVKDLAQIR